jgi:alpha-amylase
MLKNALTYILTGDGIPIMYYGTEQEFNGGDDPNDREPLWPTGLNTDTDIYKFVSTINSVRKSQEWYNEPQVERYAQDNFYAYTRGSTLVVLTNDENQEITNTISFSDYKGGVLTNIADESDQVQVGDDGSYTVTIKGIPKIYTYQNTQKYME